MLQQRPREDTNIDKPDEASSSALPLQVGDSASDSGSLPPVASSLRPARGFSEDSPFGVLARRDPNFLAKIRLRPRILSQKTSLEIDAPVRPLPSQPRAVQGGGDHTEPPHSQAGTATDQNGSLNGAVNRAVNGAVNSGVIGERNGEVSEPIDVAASARRELTDELRRAFEAADVRWNPNRLAEVTFSNIDRANLVARIQGVALRVSYDVIRLRSALDRLLEEQGEPARADDPVFPEFRRGLKAPAVGLAPGEEVSLSGLRGARGEEGDDDSVSLADLLFGARSDDFRSEDFVGSPEEPQGLKSPADLLGGAADDDGETR